VATGHATRLTAVYLSDVVLHCPGMALCPCASVSTSGA